ncbi:MAG: hypothetical protein HOC79_01790 [Euryarchaeota archaeon]|nr:hypothetical protein [Euryarchaeota archaeon]
MVIPRKKLRDPKAIEKTEGLILHSSIKAAKESHNSSISALFRWGDKDRVMKVCKLTPIPLLLAFHRVNRINEINNLRLCSKAKWQMEGEYVRAALVFGTEAKSGEVKWPRKGAGEEDLPPQFRHSDRYALNLIENAPEVRNMIRNESPESLPATVKKTKESVLEWL